MSAGAGADLAKFNPGEKASFKCQKCPENWALATEQQLRVAGWRIWRGTTASGAESEVVLCAVCAGNAGTVGATGEVEGFDATCNTCGECATDEDWDEPLTEQEAKDWCREHECEPQTEVIKPKASIGIPASTAPVVESVSAKAAFV